MEKKLSNSVMQKLEKACNKYDLDLMTDEQNEYFKKKAQERFLREKIAKIESSSKTVAKKINFAGLKFWNK